MVSKLLLLFLPVSITLSFTINSTTNKPIQSVLYGGRVKRGRLGKSVPKDLPIVNRRQTSVKRKTSEGDVSPDLIKFIQNKDSNVVVEEEEIEVATEREATTYSSFKKQKTSDRRLRQSERQAAQEARNSEILDIVSQINDALGIVNGDENDEKNKKPSSNLLQDLTPLVNSLIQVGTLTETLNIARDYRLAWVGSDDAVCHVGTGLHKVPLARLQEVFLTVNRQSLIWREVIRLIGPFPNVKNVLRGKFQSSADTWNVEWDSMIDGTGKELLAGEDARKLGLRIHVVDRNVIVATVPDQDTDGTPMGREGTNVLLFLAEDNMDLQLEELRVA